MTAKKGDWVRIRSVILPAAERSPGLPAETRTTDIRMWTKGFLQDESAAIGDTVTVETYIGRLESGTLTEINPQYQLDYGKSLPELLYIGRQVREAVREYEESGKEGLKDER